MKTKIEWTDATWNPLSGCSRVSTGCENCYAEGIARRFSGPGQNFEGLIAKGGQWNGHIKLHSHKLDEPWRWVRPRRVFVNSMSDLFHENVPFEFIATVFAVMSVTTRHTYQVLTKRPARMLEFFHWLNDGMALDHNSHWVIGDNQTDHLFQFLHAHEIQWEPCTKKRGGYDNCGPTFPYENVWLGVSVENQETADERIDLLSQCPAKVRFISAEPLLGPISITQWPLQGRHGWPGLNWVICGGESGPGARPMHPDWARSLRDQCQAAGVPFFFKQWGEWLGCDQFDLAIEIDDDPEISRFDHREWGDGKWAEPWRPMWCDWQDGNIDAANAVIRIGKKRAGRLLDGREWNEMPLA